MCVQAFASSQLRWQHFKKHLEEEKSENELRDLERNTNRPEIVINDMGKEGVKRRWVEEGDEVEAKDDTETPPPRQKSGQNLHGRIKKHKHGHPRITDTSF